MNRVNQALSLAERGYPVFPCVPNGKAPATANGFKDATTDPNRIAEMFDNVPDANIGLATAGLVVPDIDPLEDGTPNPWPETVPDSLEPGAITRTPRGGQHRFFRENGHEIRNSASLIAPKVDIRATGGYVIAPGSVINGKEYEPLVELPPRDQLPVVPEFIERKLIGGGGLFEKTQRDTTPPPTSTTATAKAVVSAGADEDVIPKGTRNDTMFRWACSLRRIGLSDAEILAAMRERNQRLCKPPMIDGELSGIAIRVVREYEPDQAAQAVAEGRADQHRIKTAAERFPIFNGPALDALDCRLVYLIWNMLVAGQPMLIAGARKCLKTSILLELAISIASGFPFLGTFIVPERKRVLVISGESGQGTIQETCRRIAKSRGIELRALERLMVCFETPRLMDPMDIARIEEVVVREKIDVVAFDPAYMMLAGLEDPNPITKVAPYLMALTELGARTNATVILCHHTKKSVPNPHDMPELGDESGVGYSEWARQWIYLARRESFDAESPGLHKLWMNVGGSAGHGGGWALDIEEGKRTDPDGRYWSVSVSSARREIANEINERENAKREAKERQAMEQVEAHAAKLLAVFLTHPAGETKSAAWDEAGLNPKHGAQALSYLIKHGQLVATDVKKCNAIYPAYKAVQPRSDNSDTVRQESDCQTVSGVGPTHPL